MLIGGREIRVNFWDLSGHPEFFEVRNEFYKDSQGAILVYDVNSKKSFDELDNWVNECTKFGSRNISIVVCGNKTDGQKRIISTKQGREWANKKGFLYVTFKKLNIFRFFETSAMSGENVTIMFESLFSEILNNLYNS